MPVQKTYKDKDLIIYEINGEIEYEEIRNTLSAIYSDNPIMNILWDIRQGTVSKLNYNQLNAIANFVSDNSEQRRSGKTAIVASKDVDYGIGRILDTLAEIKNVPFSLQVFRDYDAALAWLKSDQPV